MRIFKDHGFGKCPACGAVPSTYAASRGKPAFPQPLVQLVCGNSPVSLQQQQQQQQGQGQSGGAVGVGVGGGVEGEGEQQHDAVEQQQQGEGAGTTATAAAAGGGGGGGGVMEAGHESISGHSAHGVQPQQQQQQQREGRGPAAAAAGGGGGGCKESGESDSQGTSGGRLLLVDMDETIGEGEDMVF